MDRVRWRQAGWQSDEEEDDKFLFFKFFFVNRLYSFLPSSLLNARLCFHVIHPHLIIQHKVSFSPCFISFFFFKNKVNNFTCDLLFSFWISELKNVDSMPKKFHKKLPSEWLLERKHPAFFITPLLSRRNVGMTSKESICLNTRISDLG